MERNARKEIVGIVTSDRMDKTITVSVERKKNTQSTASLSRTQPSLPHTMKRTSAE
jgi:ribosomal protein S17